MVGWATTEDGKHIELTADVAQELWRSAMKAKAQREAAMPDEQSAIKALNDAYTRLLDFGWQAPQYAPKDGSTLDLLELGSTGIHAGQYDGEWPTGRWWLFCEDGDMYSVRPAMARAAKVHAIERGQHIERKDDD